jgi:hypothetical protein
VTKADRVAFTSALHLLAEGFAEPLSPLRVQAYWFALEDLPIAAVERGVGRALREQLDFFPKPGRLREYAKPKSVPVLNIAAYQPYRPALGGPVRIGALAQGALATAEDAAGAPPVRRSR